MGGMFQTKQIHKHSNIKAMALEKIFSRLMENIAVGQLRICFPSGAVHTFSGSVMPDKPHLTGQMNIYSWHAIIRAIKAGSVGLAEGYMWAEWDSPDLTSLLRVLAENMDIFEARLRRSRLMRLRERVGHWFNRNSRSGARRNISYHYDLGNDFYALWLDETMTYSAALFDENSENLTAAQNAKYAVLAQAVGIKQGDHVLEIGCGWGGFAEYAIREYGCRVTGVTLSQEQLNYAKSRLEKLELSDNANIMLCDYRDVKGQFDHIISIEMMEAVGELYWQAYFDQIKHLLAPGGRAGIQAITIENERFQNYRASVDFIQKYIFPGGMLPSDAMMQGLAEKTGFTITDKRDFGIGYADTLKQWHENFVAKLPEVRALGYGLKFERMWCFYLSYCEAGFRQKTIDVSQYVFQS
jgi:cyclopropane-fatty-acyl-phospholipid synthase